MKYATLNNRLPGLDFLRALAVTLVFLSHYEFITGFNPFGILSEFGGIGVDLFFVLSGYLIGSPLFAALKLNQPFRLKDFYLKRFFRIFPAFYAVVLIYFIAPGPIEQPLQIPLWKFLSYTMNINATVAGGLSNAWSLCVEEHFYMFFPLLAIFFLRKWKPLYFIGLLTALLVGTISMRYFLFTHYVQQADNYLASYLRYIYFPTFSRLDGVLFGVAAAFCRNFYSALWIKLSDARWSTAYFISGLFALFMARCLFSAETLKIWSSTLGFTLSSAGSFMLLLAAVQPGSLLNQRKLPGITALAAWSYSIYLTQKISIYFVFELFAHHWKAYNFSYLCVLAVALCTLFGGWLLYSLVERPFMRLRDQLLERAAKAGATNLPLTLPAGHASERQI